MFDILDFEEVFDFDSECSYDEDAVKKIEAHRKDLEGLFVDRVMKLLGIKRPAKFYPPKTNGDLRALHHTIVESNGADHHKIAILHYILQEFDYVNGNRLIANSFEERAYLPKRYVTYMKGLWHLDRAEFEDALQYLTHPSLIPTFADEILELLVKKAKKQDLTLALAYYQTVQPAVTSQRALECLFMAIARTSVTEAFYLSRGQPSFTRCHMFEMLIAAVLNNSTSDTVADRGVELINLPLSDEEEVWFEEYLLRGEGKALRKGKDTVMMRRIGTGKFTESLSMKGSNSNRAIGGLDWSNLSAAVQDGLGPRVHV